MLCLLTWLAISCFYSGYSFMPLLWPLQTYCTYLGNMLTSTPNTPILWQVLTQLLDLFPKPLQRNESLDFSYKLLDVPCLCFGLLKKTSLYLLLERRTTSRKQGLVKTIYRKKSMIVVGLLWECFPGVNGFDSCGWASEIVVSSWNSTFSSVPRYNRFLYCSLEDIKHS